MNQRVTMLKHQRRTQINRCDKISQNSCEELLTHNLLCGTGRAPQREVSDPSVSALSGGGRMRCSKCGCQEDKVIDSRTSREGATIRRRRECLSCGHRFTTYEEIENEG